VGFARVAPASSFSTAAQRRHVGATPLVLVGKEACKHLECNVPKAAIVDPLVVLVLKVAGGGAAFALFVYVLCRAILSAKKAGGTGSGEILAVLLLGLGTGIAPTPPREVKAESRHLGDQDDSGGPPKPTAEPTGRKAQ
jgi:hypothetical protein